MTKLLLPLQQTPKVVKALGAAHLHDPEATLVGGTQTVLIGAMALATQKRNDSDLQALNLPSSTTSKVISREVMQMGQLAFNSASRSHAPELQLGEPVCSNTAVYLSQDLYCLASSAGAAYLPWPMSSHDIAPQATAPPPNWTERPPDRPAAAGGGKAHQAPAHSGPAHVDSDDQSQHSRTSHGTLATHASAKSGNTHQTSKEAPSLLFKAPSYYLVSRKIVPKTSSIYPYAIDKRCVFMVCTVDNVADTSELSQQERDAQRLLVKAKAGLRRSELLRKGAKTYALPDDSPLDMPISSGENFSRIMRRNLSSKLLAKEAAILQPRRDKEKTIKGHFANFCLSWDQSDQGDDVSVASRGWSLASPSPYDSGQAPPTGLEQPSVLTVGTQHSHYSEQHSLQSMQSGPSHLNSMTGHSMGHSVDYSQSHSQAISTAPKERTPLPDNHREAYLSAQQAILDESRRAAVLRPYHYDNYPQVGPLP